MATYNSTLSTSNQKGWTSAGATSLVLYSEFTPPTVNTGDVIKMLSIPVGARVVNWTLGADQLDSNGAPLITLSLGDSISSTRYVNASVIARTVASVPVAILNSTGFGFQYTADDYIAVTVTAGAATPAVGKVRLYIEYVIV